jgi:hypothetical protein
VSGRSILAEVKPAPVAVPSGLVSARANGFGELMLAGSGPGGAMPIVFEPPAWQYESIGAGVLSNSGVMRIVASTLIEVTCINLSAASIFFQVFDALAVPADGTAPVTTPIIVPAGKNMTWSPNLGQGYVFSTGIAWCSSTTALTKTLTAAPDMTVSAGGR